ncbi:MAG: 16S rRNA (guanine(527)-N(7))-methyltransferase RsmG [Lutibacter sp.]|uniref:16S rRNA (guanine(527)-N(7))-methyltransferase RsmG n=1 Tax=Lutibacter sp. TaxID=1925666 RepID=UPI0017EC29B7|nr:16S rRNA (guanine(527)-N(7))-methyltransferase RsmG [Lutibacter sp.]MBT8316525.1 16S rRNA (guanine(527)-N(7))-methyltransferase RsmG [Lutibacter sp.]NNJ57385.1 16S rRNA (guanine(527)-N(7))-methyltransferase RsmG [Lutibacter sp.]
MEILLNYFSDLSETQINQFSKLKDLYIEWNAQINVISRKDIDELYLKHVLHSLGIAKVQNFKPGTRVLDVGTGGGFPGIPLAILFPETNFYLVDSIGKKIKVVNEITKVLELNNVKAEHLRAENVKGDFDFIVSRAVTKMDDFVKWVRKKVAKKQQHALKNGILYLKGGDLTEELINFPKAKQFNLSDYFTEEFFETKKVVHIPLKFKP